MENVSTIPFLPDAYSAKKQLYPQDVKIQAALDRLCLGKMTWEQFLQGKPVCSHPALSMSSTQQGNSLLHIAVLFDRADLVEEIVTHEPHMKLRRNAMGLTPLELAHFLPRGRIAAILHQAPCVPFCSQPYLSIPEMEKFLIRHDLTYLPQIRYESETVFREIVNRTHKAKEANAIPTERIWMGIYFDHEIQKGLHPKVAIRFTDTEVGFGIFAEQRIPSCAFVGEYTGLVQEKKKLPKESVYAIQYMTWEMGKRQFVINAEKMGNFTRFINHSVKPNTGVQSIYWRGMPRMIFVALKEISEGTQLTFDYGTSFWKECQKTPKII